MQVRAVVRDVRVSPRKVRLVLRELPGKRVEDALMLLQFAATPSAKVVAKIVRSAAANAENNYQLSPRDLRVAAAYADGARMLKRFKPRSRGRVSPIKRRYSHITVVVADEEA